MTWRQVEALFEVLRATCDAARLLLQRKRAKLQTEVAQPRSFEYQPCSAWRCPGRPAPTLVYLPSLSSSLTHTLRRTGTRWSLI
jgi:hypothetical protein